MVGAARLKEMGEEMTYDRFRGFVWGFVNHSNYNQHYIIPLVCTRLR